MKCTQCNGFGYIDNLEGDGLRCPKCNGTGECEPFDTDVELDKLYPTKQTNEEWLRNLSFNELARVLYCMIINGERIRPDLAYIKQWLKEKHGESE